MQQMNVEKILKKHVKKSPATEEINNLRDVALKEFSERLQTLLAKHPEFTADFKALASEHFDAVKSLLPNHDEQKRDLCDVSEDPESFFKKEVLNINKAENLCNKIIVRPEDEHPSKAIIPHPEITGDDTPADDLSQYPDDFNKLSSTPNNQNKVIINIDDDGSKSFKTSSNLNSFFNHQFTKPSTVQDDVRSETLATMLSNIQKS